MLNNKQYLQELKEISIQELFGMGEYNKDYPDMKDHLPRSMWKKLPPDLIKFIVEIKPYGIKKPSDIADQHSAKTSSGFFKQDMSLIGQEMLDAVMSGNREAKRVYGDIVKNKLYGVLNTGYADVSYKRPDGKYNTGIYYSFKDGHIWDGGANAKWIRTPYKQWIQNTAKMLGNEKTRIQSLKTELNPEVLKLTAAKLPTNLREFAIKSLSERKFDKGGTVVHKDYIPNPTIKDLDNEHKSACDEIVEFDDALQTDLNIRLVDDRLLYMVYDKHDYRLYHSRWFSFKDGLIYRYTTTDGPKGFYTSDDKLVKPVPYKQWMKDPKRFERY